MCKDVFIDRHKQLDVVEDCKNFLKKIEELKLYMFEFEKNVVIKDKIYLSDYTIHGNDYHLMIIITHDKYTFPANNRIWKAWIQKRDMFLQIKGQG